MKRLLTIVAVAAFGSSVLATPPTSMAQAQDATTATAPQTEPGADALDRGVEVSLGRAEVKQQLADQLGLPLADVPLSVHIPLDLAKRVCGEEVFDSELDTNRSCTATHYAPELAAIAQESLKTDAPSQAPGGATSQGTDAPLQAQGGTAPAAYMRWSKLRDAGGAVQGGAAPAN